MKLAEALLRRKELEQKLSNMRPIRNGDLFETRIARQSVGDNIDEAKIVIPKLSLSQVTEEFDFYAKRLRMIDGVIQQANWTTEVESVINDCDVNADYTAKTSD